jgi:hypothetical protein
MMSGSRRQVVTPALRDYVMPHDQRIASLTGLSFGQDYFDGLLRDETAVFDSTPPIAAILLAEQLGLPDLAMLSACSGRITSADCALPTRPCWRSLPGSRDWMPPSLLPPGSGNTAGRCPYPAQPQPDAAIPFAGFSQPVAGAGWAVAAAGCFAVAGAAGRLRHSLAAGIVTGCRTV